MLQRFSLPNQQESSVMIIHRLIWRHFTNRDDHAFYEMQAESAIAWLVRSGVVFGSTTRVLDLGCGHGIFGSALSRRGCQVTFADQFEGALPVFSGAAVHRIDIDAEDLSKLGQYDVVICSNVFEHLSRPERFIQNIAKMLTPAGKLFLSWTNWLSLWGGHEFSPFHYFGSRRGHRLYDKWVKRPRIHTPYQNLFPTYIGATIKRFERHPELRIVKMAPRYYPELAFILRLPVVREFLTWNCALLVEKAAVTVPVRADSACLLAEMSSKTS